MTVARKSVQVSADPAFTRLSWKVERIGWLALLVFLAAGLAGLLGPGLWPRARAGSRDDFLVRYDRFGHYRTKSDLEVRIPTGPAGGRTVSFWLDDPYLSGVEIQHIDPEPARIVPGKGRTEYLFERPEGADWLSVRFRIDFQRAGLLHGRLGHGDRTLEFRHFIYP